MVRVGSPSAAAEPGGLFLRETPGRRVHDRSPAARPGGAEGLGEERVDGPVALPRREHVAGAQREVGPREAAEDLGSVAAEAEADEYLVAHDRRRRGGAREDARRPQLLEQSADLQVLRPEVVPPLADAVGLVDRDERGREARGERSESRVREALGSDVRELEDTGAEPREPLAHLLRGQRCREEGRPDPALLERAHLVVHERDEGRDDEGGAGQERRRQLVDEALAPAGRGDEQQPSALEQRLDRLALPRAERGVPEAREATLEVERGHEAAIIREPRVRAGPLLRGAPRVRGLTTQVPRPVRA